MSLRSQSAGRPPGTADDPGPTLIESLAVLRRHWLVVLVFLVLFPALAIGYSEVRANQAEPVYDATSTLAINPSRAGTTMTMEQLAIVVDSGDIGEKARAALDGNDGVRVRAAADVARGVLIISARGLDPERVELAANTYSFILVEELDKQDLSSYQKQIQRQQNRLDNASEELRAAENRLASNSGDAELITQRDSALNEYRAALDGLRGIQTQGLPDPLLNLVSKARAAQAPQGGFTGLPHYQHVAIGLALGFLLGIGAAYLLELLDRRLGSAAEMAAAFTMPILAEIPEGGDAFAHSDALAPVGSTITEAYRRLRTVLLLERDEVREPRQAMVVLVTSAGPGEGKTTTVAHLARALGEVGMRTLAISADFRRPRLHKLLGAETLEGLAEAAKTGPRERKVVVQPTDIPNVHLITGGTGTTDPTAQIQASFKVIAEAKPHFDFIVLDSSPLLAANDSLDFAGISDRVIVVARHRKTTRPSAEKTRDMLAQIDAPTLGVVMTAVTEGDGFGYYYGYYLPNQGAEREERRRAN